MPRRVSLPRADDLFRPTVTPPVPDPATHGQEAARAADETGTTGESTRSASGRVRHDEKMTVYVTADELVDLEHARLTMRRDHGLAVDRGRLVRAAIALALEDLDAHGDDSALLERLSQT